jgi:hypothetical protein
VPGTLNRYDEHLCAPALIIGTYSIPPEGTDNQSGSSRFEVRAGVL